MLIGGWLLLSAERRETRDRAHDSILFGVKRDLEREANAQLELSSGRSPTHLAELCADLVCLAGYEW